MSFLSKKIESFKPYRFKMNNKGIDSKKYDSLSLMLEKISKSGQKNIIMASSLKSDVEKLLSSQNELISDVRQENSILKKRNRDFSESVLGYLDALDSFEFNLDLIKDNKVKETFLVILDMYKSTNEKLRLERIPVKINGEMDKSIHTAIDLESVSDESLDKKIIKIVKNGYRKGDEIIRKSSVIVGRYNKNE